MKLPTLTQAAKGSASFSRTTNETIWYALVWHDEVEGDLGQEIGSSHTMEIPIPRDDMGEGTFMPAMKGIEILRWIRKHIEVLQIGNEFLSGGIK